MGDQLEIFKNCITGLMRELIDGDQLLIVQDGPVKSDMENYIKEICFNGLDWVKLPKNLGLSEALNHGLKYIRHEIVARVDADDICLEGRFKQQIKAMELHKVDICSDFVVETGEYLDKNVIKRVPEHNFEIKKYMVFRNPINHMAVMYRKSCILNVGGYPNILGAEDYGLWITCLGSGCSFYNLQSELMMASTPKDFLSRRIDKRYLKSEWQLHLIKKKSKIANPLLLNIILLLRLIHRISPKLMNRWIYEKLRK